MPVTWTLKEWLRTRHGLTNATQIRDIIQGRAGQEISLRSINTLLKNKPKTLDIRTLQTICDVFRCQLKQFCSVKPAPLPPLKRTPIRIQHLIQPCGIGPNETLRSFIARVQMAGIRQALLMSGNNFCYACRLLGSERGYLLPLYQRHQRRTKAPHDRNPAPKQPDAKAILLPAALFTIRQNEDFQSFTRRIQVAAVIRTIKMEGNHSRAALRLGYCRTAFVRLRSHLRNDLQLQSVENTDLQTLIER
jgi:DNA-binding Xre family transcriptional regulator